MLVSHSALHEHKVVIKSDYQHLFLAGLRNTLVGNFCVRSHKAHYCCENRPFPCQTPTPNTSWSVGSPTGGAQSSPCSCFLGNSSFSFGDHFPEVQLRAWATDSTASAGHIQMFWHLREPLGQAQLQPAPMENIPAAAQTFGTGSPHRWPSGQWALPVWSSPEQSCLCLTFPGRLSDGVCAHQEGRAYNLLPCLT